MCHGLSQRVTLRLPKERQIVGVYDGISAGQDLRGDQLSDGSPVPNSFRMIPLHSRSLPIQTMLGLRNFGACTKRSLSSRRTTASSSHQ